MSASLLRRSNHALAHVNHGRWIAMCPRPDCTNAEGLEPRQVTFHCSICHLIAHIEWPGNPDGITAALASRPVPSTRNWYPKDHEFAIRARVEHGQTIADLIAENNDHGVQ